MKRYKRNRFFVESYQFSSFCLRKKSSEMNALKKLEDIKQNKPYLGFAKLSIGFHQVFNFRIVKNKFGKKTDGSNKSVLAELQNQVLFLPQCFAQTLVEEDLRELNSCISAQENIYVYFGGKQEQST